MCVCVCVAEASVLPNRAFRRFPSFRFTYIDRHGNPATFLPTWICDLTNINTAMRRIPTILIQRYFNSGSVYSPH